MFGDYTYDGGKDGVIVMIQALKKQLLIKFSDLLAGMYSFVDTIVHSLFIYNLVASRPRVLYLLSIKFIFITFTSAYRRVILIQLRQLLMIKSDSRFSPKVGDIVCAKPSEGDFVYPAKVINILTSAPSTQFCIYKLRFYHNRKLKYYAKHSIQPFEPHQLENFYSLLPTQQANFHHNLLRKVKVDTQRKQRKKKERIKECTIKQAIKTTTSYQNSDSLNEKCADRRRGKGRRVVRANKKSRLSMKSMSKSDNSKEIQESEYQDGYNEIVKIITKYRGALEEMQIKKMANQVFMKINFLECNIEAHQPVKIQKKYVDYTTDQQRDYHWEKANIKDQKKLQIFDPFQRGTQLRRQRNGKYKMKAQRQALDYLSKKQLFFEGKFFSLQKRIQAQKKERRQNNREIIEWTDPKPQILSQNSLMVPIRSVQKDTELFDQVRTLFYLKKCSNYFKQQSLYYQKMAKMNRPLKEVERQFVTYHLSHKTLINLIKEGNSNCIIEEAVVLTVEWALRQLEYSLTVHQPVMFKENDNFVCEMLFLVFNKGLISDQRLLKSKIPMFTLLFLREYDEAVGFVEISTATMQQYGLLKDEACNWAQMLGEKRKKNGTIAITNTAESILQYFGKNLRQKRQNIVIVD